ncbi:hypothetical protein KR018_007636 [Drosophila ironensis]|nr:hypothetical protein KR018_007636 [Drosophila ironensis]
MCRSLTSQQGSQRRKKSRLSTGGSEDQKKSNSLLSAFQMYSPFSSKENVDSGEEVVDLQAVIDTQPGHSLDVPHYGDFNPINPILEEEVEGAAESNKSSKKTGGGEEDGQKSKGDGGSGSGGSGGNRLKRNIKHTGSLIVRKLTAARQGATGKKEKDKEQAAGSGQQEGVATDKEKDKTGCRPEGKVAMLRTTTL